MATEISRRSFLKGAAASAAGLAVMGLNSGIAFAEEEKAAMEGMTAEKSLSTKW